MAFQQRLHRLVDDEADDHRRQEAEHDVAHEGEGENPAQPAPSPASQEEKKGILDLFGGTKPE